MSDMRQDPQDLGYVLNGSTGRRIDRWHARYVACKTIMSTWLTRTGHMLNILRLGGAEQRVCYKRI